MKTPFRTFAAGLASLTACLALPACAGEPAMPRAAAEPVAAAEKQARPALWKVADEDTTIYLFGTVHVLPQGIDWFDGLIAEAFAESGSLVTEVADNDPASLQGLVVRLAMLSGDQTLRGTLSPEQLDKYESALSHYQIPPGMFDRFEPWYAAIALSTMPLMQEGFTAENGVEQLLDRKAGERGLAHVGLETSEYQLGLFDGLPGDVQKRYLGEVIDQLPTLKTEIQAMIKAWTNGEAEELARIMNAEESDPVLVQTLLTDRNKTWAGWIDERLDRPGTVFVAVGAGHLAGAGSVQEQLSALGIASARIQ